MKKKIATILLAVSASASLLLAQAENKLEATNQITECIPIFHLPSSISCLDVTPKLMMNPSPIEEGIKAFGAALEFWKRGAVTAEKTLAEGASSVSEGGGRCDIVRAEKGSVPHSITKRVTS